jgi:hypothetical protein
MEVASSTVLFKTALGIKPGEKTIGVDSSFCFALTKMTVRV